MTQPERIGPSLPPERVQGYPSGDYSISL